MVTIYSSPSSAYLKFWRGVIERRAPQTLPLIEAAAAPATVERGSTTWTVSDELLKALTAAYREAASGRIALTSSMESRDEMQGPVPHEG
jgi:hypothetical protein